MPDTFDEIASHCLKNRTTKRDVPEEHLRERLCYVGEGRERVYCLLALIEDKLGFRWFAYIMATRDGEMSDDLEPLAEWSTARQLNACIFRGKFAELEPKMSEEQDAEGYIFRGPKPTQISESKPGGVVPSGFVSVPSDHG